VRLQVCAVTAAMRGPFAAGHGTVENRELLRVSLHDADGAAGHGEAAPLASYDGVTAADVRAALEACRPVLATVAVADAGGSEEPGVPAGSRGQAGPGIESVLARCAEVTLLPQALAAIDLALWDLAGRRAGVPVWRLLGAAPDPAPVPVNWTIAAADRAGAAAEAAAARAAGFGTIKLKVGIGDDGGRLAAVRAVAGPEMRIRIDANGAWSPEEARAALRMLAPAGIELCEEPVHGVDAIRALAGRSPVPLALDESAEDPAALAGRAADLLCLKIARCGGIGATIEMARRARAAGYEVFLASTLDGPLGIAAALHAAAVIAPERACGLATLGMFAGRADPLAPQAGAIAVPAGPGLGDGLLGWYLSPR
jgi:L-alanine-DL-glutamate epimerase-like enolase superfamily enzyme